MKVTVMGLEVDTDECERSGSWYILYRQPPTNFRRALCVCSCGRTFNMVLTRNLDRGVSTKCVKCALELRSEKQRLVRELRRELGT